MGNHKGCPSKMQFIFNSAQHKYVLVVNCQPIWKGQIKRIGKRLDKFYSSMAQQRRI
jgi:hypothetical protein